MSGHTQNIWAERAKYIAVDLLTTAAAFVVFNICRYHILHHFHLLPAETPWHYLGSEKLLLEQILVPMALLAVYALSGFYNRPFFKSRLSVANNTLCVAAADTFLIYLLILLNDMGVKRIDYLVIVTLFLLLSVFLFTGRYAVVSAFNEEIRRGRRRLRVLMVGNSRQSRRTAEQLLKGEPSIPYDVIGYIRVPGEKSASDAENVWDFDKVDEVCRQYDPDQIVIALTRRNDEAVMRLLDELLHLNKPLKIAPDTLSYVTSNIHQNDIMAMPFVDLTSPRISDFQRNVKRTGDVAVSIAALLLLLPLFAGLAVAVKYASKGPVLYRQQRLGIRRKPFTIYKFRSMVADAEATGPCLSSDTDPRITRVGHFMRKYRLDELPQFWNVLKGDMSLVGPRPERDFYARQIIAKAPYYRLIFQVRPGITSWGMVKFGYASDVDQMVERSRFDLLYINNMSISTDIKILLYTIKTVVNGEGK